MQDKSSNSKPKAPCSKFSGSKFSGSKFPDAIEASHPLAHLSADEFAALGGGKTVFIRTISAGELATFIPEAKSMPAEVQFQMIMGANGEAVLITDSQNALTEWLQNNEVNQVLVH